MKDLEVVNKYGYLFSKESSNSYAYKRVNVRHIHMQWYYLFLKKNQLYKIPIIYLKGLTWSVRKPDTSMKTLIREQQDGSFLMLEIAFAGLENDHKIYIFAANWLRLTSQFDFTLAYLMPQIIIIMKRKKIMIPNKHQDKSINPNFLNVLYTAVGRPCSPAS